MKNLLVIVVLVVLGAVLHKAFLSDRPLVRVSTGQFTNPYPPSSELHAQHQVFVDAANADEKVRERFAGTFTSKGLYAELKLALARGAQTLDAGTLVKATKAIAAVIPRLPEASCAKLIRPADDFDPELGQDVREAFERLPAYHHRNFLDFYLKALKAEVHGAPVVRVDKEVSQRALRHLGEAYPGDFGRRLESVLRDPVRAADEDACWAINSMTHTSTQLDDESAEAMSRLIWGGGG